MLKKIRNTFNQTDTLKLTIKKRMKDRKKSGINVVRAAITNETAIESQVLVVVGLVKLRSAQYI